MNVPFSKRLLVLLTAIFLITLSLPSLLSASGPSVDGPPAGCTMVSEYCSVGKAEKTVEGYLIERDCWEKRRVYSCPLTGPQGMCSALSNTEGCQRTGVTCTATDQDGVCREERSSYQCSETVNAPGITFMETVHAAPAKGVQQGLQCGSSFWCPEDENGVRVCDYGAAAQASPDFGKAASWMGMLTQMGREKDPEALTIFRGNALACSRAILNIKDCCKEDGFLLSWLGCSKQAEQLALAREDKKTHPVGTFCAEKINLGLAKICSREKDVFCAFRSRFSRIIQVQGRAQLGIGWGSPETPDCRSLSLAELQRIDFGRVNLSELYQDMLNDAQVSTKAATGQKIQSRIADYYTDRKKP